MVTFRLGTESYRVHRRQSIFKVTIQHAELSWDCLALSLQLNGIEKGHLQSLAFTWGQSTSDRNSILLDQVVVRVMKVPILGEQMADLIL